MKSLSCLIIYASLIIVGLNYLNAEKVDEQKNGIQEMVLFYLNL